MHQDLVLVELQQDPNKLCQVSAQKLAKVRTCQINKEALVQTWHQTRRWDHQVHHLHKVQLTEASQLWIKIHWTKIQQHKVLTKILTKVWILRPMTLMLNHRINQLNKRKWVLTETKSSQKMCTLRTNQQKIC
jgi:hypothetical protein